MLNLSRPNTGVQDALLSEKVIFCCGEDPAELLAALNSAFPCAENAYHEYRCYRFWKFDAFTLVWSGIGTGCIEPLLFEVLNPGIIREAVLIGTSGCIPGRNVKRGDVFIADNAYLGGAAIQLPEDAFPLTCDFDEERLKSLGLERKTSISTDLYYGFIENPEPRMQRVQERDVRLKKDLAAFWGKADVVDMEIGQFYYLCESLAAGKTRYVAIKGASNATDSIREQTLFSVAILEKTLKGALQLLQIPQFAAAEGPAEEKCSGDITKLMEEIKMYWTIQLAVCTVLGYLGSRLDFSTVGAVTVNSTKNFVLCLIAFILISIGSVYNLVGNYYIRICGYTLEGQHQEDIISPALSVAYLVISGIMGAIIGYSFINIFVQQDSSDFLGMVSGLSLGFSANFINCRFVLQELCKRDPKRIYSGKYSNRLKKIYAFTCPEDSSR